MSKTLDKLGVATVTLITGYSAGAFAFAAMGDDWATGGQVGAAITMAGYTYISLIDNRPRKPRLNQIIASAGEPIKVNGKNMFLNAMPWIGKQAQRPTSKIAVFYVPYRKQVNPIRIMPGQVELYARQGWERQINGDDAPFARSRYTRPWTPQAESCCYKILGYSGCFDTFGQGAKSKLIISPNRVRRACLVRFSPTLKHEMDMSGGERFLWETGEHRLTQRTQEIQEY